MKRLVSIILIALLITKAYTQSDSFFRYKYLLPPSEDGIVADQFKLTNNTTIFFTTSKDIGTQINEPGTYNIVKSNTDGSVYWSKKINEQNNGLNIRPKNILLLKDESLMIAGIYSKQVQQNVYSKGIFLVKILGNGALAWSKFYQLDRSVNNTDYLHNTIIAEAENGNIYGCFTVVKDIETNNQNVFRNYPVIIKFDSQGNILWDRYLFKINEEGTNCIPKSIIDLGNSIIVNADFERCETLLCNNAETYSLAIKMNASAGIVTQTKKNNFVGLTRAKAILNSGGKTFYIDGVLKSISAFSSYIQLNSQTFIADNLQAIAFDMDTSLNLKSAKEIHFKGLRNKNITPNFDISTKKISFTNDGGILLGLRDFYYYNVSSYWIDTLRYYFAKLDANFQLQWQKKFFINSQKNINLEAPSIIEKDNCNTQIVLSHITKYDVNNIQRSFEVINFNPFIKYNNPCFGEDTSFIELKDANIQQSPFFWDQEFTNILLPFNETLLLEDIPVTQTELCSIESDCSNFSLIGPDSTCIGENINLQLHKQINCLLPVGWQLPPATVADTFLLNDTTLSIRFKQPWQGNIYSYAGDCNTVIDSLFITVLPKQVPVDLGKDTLLCNNNPVLLIAGAAYKTYLWNTGSTDSLLTVSTAGKYWIMVTDYCGTASTDTIEVKEGGYSFTIEKDTTICKGDTVLLQATSGYINYQWAPPDHLSGSVSPSVLSYTENNTRYTVSAQTITGCTLEASVFVKVMLCSETCFVPNSFTPNGDGTNDLFKPIIEGSLSVYQFSIFNRYGQQVFSSTELSKGWDGTFRSVPQIPGTYIWQLSYRFKNRKPQFKKGTVLLIR